VSSPSLQSDTQVPGARAVACDGRLQGIARGTAIGWAWTPDTPWERLSVAVVVDGEIVAEGDADIQRKDLAKLGIGDGAHGFLIKLPESLQTPARRRIAVLVGAARTPLPASASFWQEPANDGTWSDVVFEPGGTLSARVAPPPASPAERAVVASGWLLPFGEEEDRAQPDEHEIERLVALLSANARACGSLGIAYIPALVPRKHEAISPVVTPERAWVTTLCARLRDEDEVELLDLLEVLRDCDARHGRAYHHTDADWNDRGAFFVARALLKEAGKRVAVLRPPALSDLHLRAVPGYRGTLADASKLRWTADGWTPCEVQARAETGVVVDPSPLQALRMPVEPHLAEAGSIHLRVYARPERDEDARLAVVGDAAALSLVVWLAERASRTTFFWSGELPLLELELELPPVVFHLLRETDLIDAARGETALGSEADLQGETALRNGTAPRGETTLPAPATSTREIGTGTGGAGSDGMEPPPPHQIAAFQRDGAALQQGGRAALALAAGRARGLIDGARALLARHAWTIALVALITVLSWPVTYATAAGGLDDSWAIGLSMGLAHGLTFGRQIIFTYGPLGVGFVPLAVTPGTFLLGELLTGLIQLALVAVLLASLRRRMSLLAACVLALLAASLVGWRANAAPLDGIAFGLVALSYTTPAARRGWALRRLALWGGAFAGFALLVKLNEGVAAGAILGVGLLGSDQRRRDLTRAAASLLGTLVVLWVLAGEPLGALFDYLRNGYEVIGGYVEAMGVNPEPTTEWQQLLVLGSAIVLAAGAWRALATERPRRGAALAGAVLALHYFVAREAFVRYGPGHVATIAVLGAAALMIPWSRAQRATGLAMAAMLALAVFAVLARPVGNIIDPLGDAHRFARQMDEVLHPTAAIATGRLAVRHEDAVPRSMVIALRGHCVTSEPDEIAAVWAHPRWRWCPLPVFQSYSAYTPRLDRLNAGAYADARHGPDRVLRQVNQAIDMRNPSWESPAAMLSLLCHFTELEHNGDWQTLARVPDRCGKPYPVGTIHSSLGREIALPTAPTNAVLVAAIDGIQVAGWERLETLFTRSQPRYVTVNDQRATHFRVPPGTASDGLILAVPAYADYATPFNLNMSPQTLRVEVEGHTSGSITVRLFAVPIQ
jgi:hypothetical protein